MITITIPAQELYNEAENRFFNIEKPVTVQLEHCLLSVSKWEMKWHIPFLDKEKKTKAQAISYLHCMCLDPSIPEEVFFGVPVSEMDRVLKYIEDPMTATKINDKARSKKGNTGEVVTSELIYYWMNECNIDMSCETWPLTRLMNLVEITSIKRQPEKKMSKRDIMSHNKSLNAIRRAKMGSLG